MNIIINLLHFFKLFLKTINILFVFLFLQNSYSQSEYNKVLEIQNKIIEKNKGIINVSWRYSQHNSAYFDTSYNYNHNYYDSKNNKLYASNINKLLDTPFYNLFIGDSSHYIFVDKIGQNTYCQKTATLEYFKSNWRNVILHLALPYSKTIIEDTNVYNYKVIKTDYGDSIIVSEKQINKESVQKIYFIDNQYRIQYFKEIISFEIAQFPITQTIIYDSFIYSDSTIDIEPFFKLKSCSPPPEFNSYNIKEVNLDDLFLNKRFDFKPLAKYLDSNTILNSGKITILDYSYISCFGCVLLLKSYEKILDSFSNQISIILIDPVDQNSKKAILDKSLVKYNIYNKVNSYITYNNAKEITYNGAINAYPTLFFLDQNGIVRFIKVGVNRDENIYETFKKEIERITKLSK